KDAEVHGGDRLAGGEPGAAGGDEPALAEGGALGAGHVEQAGAGGQVLAELEGAEVLLVAVGRDHRGVPGLVQDPGHLPQRVVAGPRAVQAGHRPDLDHGRRGRVLVAGSAGVDRLEPVADHRQVDRVAGGAGTGLPGRGQAGGGLPDGGFGTHRGALGRPRPAVAISSRWISFTPPPNVSTMFRLTCTSSHLIRFAVSGSASACRPTTSASSGPISWSCSEEKTLVADASATSNVTEAGTCQLSSSLTRVTVAARSSARRMSGWVSRERAAAQARTRSCRAPIRPAGPSMTRSWLSWVVISRQPSFSAPTRIRAGTRTP